MTWQWIVWTYVVLLVAGGAVGFFKAGSKISLITSLAFALPLALAAAGILPVIVAQVMLGLVAVAMGVRFAKSRRFMPAGMICALSVAALVTVILLTRGA